MEEFDDFCSRHSLSYDEVMYFGDDLPDIDVLKACGIGVAPADAVAEAMEAADYVSPYKGGHGCVRNAIEAVMKAQGIWKLDNALYKKLF